MCYSQVQVTVGGTSVFLACLLENSTPKVHATVACLAEKQITARNSEHLLEERRQGLGNHRLVADICERQVIPDPVTQRL